MEKSCLINLKQFGNSFIANGGSDDNYCNEFRIITPLDISLKIENLFTKESVRFKVNKTNKKNTREIIIKNVKDAKEVGSLIIIILTIIGQLKDFFMSMVRQENVVILTINSITRNTEEDEAGAIRFVTDIDAEVKKLGGISHKKKSLLLKDPHEDISIKKSELAFDMLEKLKDFSGEQIIKSFNDLMSLRKTIRTPEDRTQKILHDFINKTSAFEVREVLEKQFIKKE